MMKKTIIMLLAAVPAFCLSTVQAKDIMPKVKVQVGQKGDTLESAQVPVQKKATFQFDAKGQLVVTLGQSTTPVAKLPIQHGANVTVDCAASTPSDKSQRTVAPNPMGYAMVSSAFQMVVPEQVEVFAPRYNAETKELNLTQETRLPAGAIVPAGTGLLVKSAETVSLDYAAEEQTTEFTSDLLASVIEIPVTEAGKGIVYLLDQQGTTLNKYAESTLSAGQAYLLLEEETRVPITLFDEAVGIEEISHADTSVARRYNLQGQYLQQAPDKGLYIQGRKKVIVNNTK